jgi:beta-glucosidase
MKTGFFLCLIGLTALTSCKQSGKPTTHLTKEDQMIEQKIDSLLKLMTLEEKVGQMVQYNGNGDATGPIKARTQDIDDLKKGYVGSMLNVTGAEQTRDMQKLVMENSRLKIPLIFGLDVIHGYKTIFPVPLGEAASWDLAAIENSAHIAAVEATAAGVHWTFAPMVDIARDPRWGRIMEGAGEDPYYGSQVAIARVHGFQGKTLKDQTSLVACAKHFAAYGAAEGGRDYNTADMSKRVLNEIYLRPFKAAVEAGVGTLMNSFNELDGIPATGNPYLVKETLKDNWGFRGFVVSDWNSIGEMVTHGVAKDTTEAAVLAIQAGNDMDMETFAYRNHLASLVKQDKVKESMVDDAVRRILRIKFQLGLFDNPYKNCDVSLESKVMLSPEHLQAARDGARKSIVLLKNQGQLLPLKTDAKSIAVIGPLADAPNEMIGNWSAKGEGKDAVSLIQGIKAAVSPATKILYAKGCNIGDDSTQLFSKAISTARQADVVVMAVGEGANWSGEAYSRTNINIPGVQEDLLKEIVKTGKPVVMVLMNGRPLTIPWAAEHVPAILETWLLGTQAGNAIADVLFGKYNPSGKLPVSFPYSVGQIPVYYNHKNTGRPKTDPNYKWCSRYMDSPNEALFPFGFGLSYTTFAYSNLKLSSNHMKMDGSVDITVSVKNSGKTDGEEVVQLYIRDLVGSVTRPVKELKGFRKIMIKAGEEVHVSFTIKASDLAFFTKDMSFKAEPGDFKVFVGPSSVEGLEGAFVLEE